MARDYVKKGKPASRAKRGAKSAPPPPPAPSKKPKAFIFVFLVIGILAGFGYFLWSIKDRAPDSAEPVQNTQPKQAKPKPLPKIPEEKWEYVKELENKEVEVDVPEREDGPKRPYQMQCGSFRSEQQANVMKAQIAFAGLESIIKRTEGNNGVWYRVVLGPYNTKRDAEADRHRLQDIKINSCQIWYWT
ncbi:Sporulation-like protein [Catenovulum agarivorans DS-2]|uniref:Sporulation-like protein n=1 Tax=Catenovulum agarivorans DS-2 TaxID=1328313 RepID=W7QYK0_9ALTE|nr:SPOR domain-containing protein [Catenovulum agarivorans]EWH10450.1 Sporulation-like protein [Catenovulum agarivorans DS-2]